MRDQVWTVFQQYEMQLWIMLGVQVVLVISVWFISVWFVGEKLRRIILKLEEIKKGVKSDREKGS